MMILTTAGDEASSASVLRIVKAKAVSENPDLHRKISKTASRSVYRLMGRLNLKWNIPISEVIYHTDLGLDLTIPYIKPSDALAYLLANHPEVVMGGFRSMQEGTSLLQGFWNVFKRYHGSHEVFREHGDSLPYCLPLYLYGDEGRGRRRGNTAIFVMEFPFGSQSASVAQQGKRKHECSCCPQESSLKKFCGNNRGSIPVNATQFALHNYKGHSFLTRFVLFCLPCATYKAFPTLIPFLLDLIAKDLRSLFFEGVQIGPRTFTPVCLGLKADIKFHAYVGNFDRWYSNRGKKSGRQCCHECLAGDARWPQEDIAERPGWEPTIFSQRPWADEPTLTQIPFDRTQPERMYKRDPFHICKMGLYRHVTASILAVCLLWGYCNDPEADDGNNIPVLIKRAYGHFRLWALTYNKSPALRSFSKQLMSWPNLTTSPWFNTKGSDCMLLMSWLDTFVGQLLLNPLQPDHVPVLTLMRSVLQSGKAAFDLMTSHRLLVPRNCAIQLYEHLAITLNGYAWLARWSVNQQITAFAMIPKVHAWKHEALDLFTRLKIDVGEQYFLSPLIHSCEVNEDTIGRISRLSRKVDSRKMERRCLQLFLSKCHFLHKRAFPKLKA